MQSGIRTPQTIGDSWYDCKPLNFRIHVLALINIFPQLERALSIVSRIPPGAISDLLRQTIVKLRKQSVYKQTSQSLILPSQFTMTLAILLLRASVTSMRGVLQMVPTTTSIYRIQARYSKFLEYLQVMVLIYIPGWPTILSFRPANQPVAPKSASRSGPAFRYVRSLSS